MNDFGKRLKETRKSRHMTQNELAREANVSRESIVNYENGRRKMPASDIVNRLAGALNVTGWWLATGDEYELSQYIFEAITGIPSPLKGSKAPIPLPEQRIMLALQKLNEEGKQEAAKRVEELTEVPRFQNPDFEEYTSP